MSARKQQPDRDQQAIDALFDARTSLEAIEASRGWATRVIFAGATGDQQNVAHAAVLWILDRYFHGPQIDHARDKLRKSLDKQAEGMSPYVEKLLIEATAAVEGASLAVGIAVGMQMRPTVDDLKSARGELSLTMGGVKEYVANRRKAIGPPEHEWQCDKG